MRKMLISAAMLCAAAFMFDSCVTSSSLVGQKNPNANTSSQAAAANVLQDLLGGLLNSAVKLNEQSLVGTWEYLSPECRFESENALAQAGGSIAATQVEEKLAEAYSKLGIKPGACSFTFKEDKTCSINLGGRSMGGTYALNPQTNDLTISTTMGLVRINGKVYLTTSGLAVLFDANKLLQLAQTVSAVTGQSDATIGALGSLLGQYKGMMVGMNLKK